MSRLISQADRHARGWRFGHRLTGPVVTFFLWVTFLCAPAIDARAADWREVFINDPFAGKAFQSGLKDYRNGDYGRAERRFRSLLPAKRVTDAEVVSLFVAKCMLAQKLYPETEAWLAACRDEFIGGRYEDVFSYLGGHVAYLTGDPAGAAELYLQAYRKSRDRHLKELVVASLAPLFARWLDDACLRGLADEIPQGPAAAEFYYQRGRRYEERERLTLAEKNYREVVRRGRGGKWYLEAKERIAELQARLKRTTRIGLLYPASGPLAEFGEQMLRAARLAAETWHKNDGGFIEIVPEDTYGDPLQASIAARRLSEEGVAAAVGPLTSESAVAAANVLSCAGFLHILPVASQPGLTALSGKLYQLNSPPPTVGEVLARHAIDVLGDSTFAILAPDEAYGRRISRAFQKTALQKGAFVFPVQYCRPGQTDYGTELMRIKRIILRELYDSTVFIAADGDTLDEEQVPVYLGGFLLPGDAEDLNDILPQIRFYNIFTRYLGTDGWSHPQRLSRAREYLEGAIFASAEYHPADDRQWARFLSAWRGRYGDEPGLVAARTFDGVILAASLLAGQKSSSSGRDKTPADFHGASGKVEFSSRRVNMHVPLYGYLGGRIVPVGELPVSEPNSSAR